MLHPYFYHNGIFTGTPDAVADAVGLISALFVEQELQEARERRERSIFYETDDESDDPHEVKPEV